MSTISVKTASAPSELIIADGRYKFWQWDVGCQIRVIGLPSVIELHYFNRGMAEPIPMKVYEQGDIRLCDVPDELLQVAGDLEVYAYYIGDDERQTRLFRKFGVKARPKPSDYVYTETEMLTWSELDRRMGELEKYQNPNAIRDEVDEYLRENPPEGFKPDESLILENGVLSVNTTNEVESDNTLPITSAAVATTVGNIEILLKTI